MSKKDIFGDEIETKNMESFEALFEQSGSSVGRNLKTGDSFTGEILSVGKEESFVATGGPLDAMIFTRDLMDDQKNMLFKSGDIIDCIVIATKGGEIRAARKGAKGVVDTESLEDAFDMELPVEGRVVEAVKGGLRVQIQGKMAFCPVSQIDSRFVQDLSEYIDKKFEFLITQYDKRNIVVSRRRLLDLKKAEFEGTFMLQHQPGEILDGKVMRLEPFGAFVDLGNGIEGLVHISELAWSRIHHPQEVLTVGQAVSVKLLKTEEIDGKLKISLSIKQADGEGNPWLTVPARFPVGTVVKATVEKKEAFGLFVNLAPGVTGLLPKSKWRDALDTSMYENKKRGDEITVQVDELRFEEKRISLGLPREQDDMSWKSHASDQKSSSAGFGSLGDALKGLSIKTNK